ncbi:hypothetical protein Pint_35910 [Pistacia integerrima]|uniref:Uncharacterized protein n=1 Tax=Pistacia integerrima TaxID=434235 RepID=A0ACC0Y3F4_9ROSI|nr:hypothetical protein Pint_35910 [Pistacia integerrima]
MREFRQLLAAKVGLSRCFGEKDEVNFVPAQHDVELDMVMVEAGAGSGGCRIVAPYASRGWTNHPKEAMASFLEHLREPMSTLMNYDTLAGRGWQNWKGLQLTLVSRMKRRWHYTMVLSRTGTVSWLNCGWRGWPFRSKLARIDRPLPPFVNSGIVLGSRLRHLEVQSRKGHRLRARAKVVCGCLLVKHCSPYV